MASSDSRSGERVPAALRIRLKYPDEATFVQKYGTNISRGGVFIATRTPKPVGTTVRFEFQLADGDPIIRGEGQVAWVKPYDEQQPEKVHGMGVRFSGLDGPSRQVIERVLAWKEQARRAGTLALSPLPSTLPEDTRSLARASLVRPGDGEGRAESPAAELFGTPPTHVKQPTIEVQPVEIGGDEEDEEVVMGAAALAARHSDDDEEDGMEITIGGAPVEAAGEVAAPPEPAPGRTEVSSPALVTASWLHSQPAIQMDVMLSSGATLSGVGDLGPLPEIGDEPPLAPLEPAPPPDPADEDAALARLAADWGLSQARVDGAAARARSLVGAVVEKLSGGDGEFDWLLEPARPEPLPSPSQARALLARMLAARERNDADR